MPQLEGDYGRGIAQPVRRAAPQPSRAYSAHRTSERASQSRRRVVTKKKASSSSGYSSAARRRISSSRGQGGQSAPRIRASRSGQYSRPRAPSPATAGPIKPIIPDLAKYLGSDSVYVNEQRQFGKTLADFLAESTRKKGQVNTEFGLSQKELEGQRLKDLDDIKEDYASRGLLKSGLYAGRTGEYEKEYGTRISDLQRRRTQSLGDLGSEETQFKRELELQKEGSKQSAARRRAQKYGL